MNPSEWKSPAHRPEPRPTEPEPTEPTEPYRVIDPRTSTIHRRTWTGDRSPCGYYHGWVSTTRYLTSDDPTCTGCQDPPAVVTVSTRSATPFIGGLVVYVGMILATIAIAIVGGALQDLLTPVRDAPANLLDDAVGGVLAR